MLATIMLVSSLKVIYHKFVEEFYIGDVLRDDSQTNVATMLQRCVAQKIVVA